MKHSSVQHYQCGELSNIQVIHFIVVYHLYSHWKMQCLIDKDTLLENRQVFTLKLCICVWHMPSCSHLANNSRNKNCSLHHFQHNDFKSNDWTLALSCKMFTLKLLVLYLVATNKQIFLTKKRDTKYYFFL